MLSTGLGELAGGNAEHSLVLCQPWEGVLSNYQHALAIDDLRHSDHFVDQRHSEYCAAAHGVWQKVLARNAQLIAELGHRMDPVYIEGLRELELPKHVPTVEQLNRRLAPTGWQTVCVDGYIPSAAYAELISQGIFPISRVIRRPEHVDFAPDPDLVHDVLGHLPLLFSPEYRRYLRRFGAVMSKARENELDDLFFSTVRDLATIKSDPESSVDQVVEVEARMRRVVESISDGASELTHLRRLYVWSIEFGVIGSPDDFSIHGAALLSAPAEFRAVCARGAACLRTFAIDAVEYENAFSDLLSHYFVAHDFGHLHDVLTEYERLMVPGDRALQTSEIRQITRTSKDLVG